MRWISTLFLILSLSKLLKVSSLSFLRVSYRTYSRNSILSLRRELSMLSLSLRRTLISLKKYSKLLLSLTLTLCKFMKDCLQWLLSIILQDSTSYWLRRLSWISRMLSITLNKTSRSSDPVSTSSSSFSVSRTKKFSTRLSWKSTKSRNNCCLCRSNSLRQNKLRRSTSAARLLSRLKKWKTSKVRQFTRWTWST